MTVMMEGTYLEGYLAEAGGETPTFTDEELKTIASPVDFVGINVYTTGVVRRGQRRAAGLSGDPVQRLAPEDAVGVAPLRSGGHVLGAEARAIDLEDEVDLHHRERLRGSGRRSPKTATSTTRTA